MKKISEKLFCIILCVIILCCSSFSFSSFASDRNDGSDIPIIYIIGSGEVIYVKDENGTERNLFPVQLPVDKFVQVAKDNIGMFAKALVTQEWTDFGNLVRDTVSPYYHELALDENGNAPNGSTCRWTYNKENLKKANENGRYPTHNYEFIYDWRMDPYKIADDLHQYIEDVLEVTGEEHVAIMGRCLGACIAAAYMDKYDCEYVTDLIIYAGALKGATICSKLFSGDLYLDDDGIERYVYDMSLSPDKLTNELIQAFVTVFNATYGLDIACWAVNNVWDNIYLDIMPQILIDSFGTWPGYWSMVSDEDYVRAKENVFHNADMEKWSGFIDIIDNYHYNVQVKAEEHLKEYSERGIDVYNITKYGYQAIPLSVPSDMISDSYCSVEQASFGATTSSLFSTFSDEYIATADERYISPDKQIDASTCLFPEKTWFIKNMQHKSFPGEMDAFLNEMVNTPDMNIYSDSKYPQYMVLVNNNPVPMNQDNMDTTQRYVHNFWDSLRILFKNLFTLLKNKIQTNNPV